MTRSGAQGRATRRSEPETDLRLTVAVPAHHIEVMRETAVPAIRCTRNLHPSCVVRPDRRSGAKSGSVYASLRGLSKFATAQSADLGFLAVLIWLDPVPEGPLGDNISPLGSSLDPVSTIVLPLCVSGLTAR